jgi:hypothetical protein
LISGVEKAVKQEAQEACTEKMCDCDKEAQKLYNESKQEMDILAVR